MSFRFFSENVANHGLGRTLLMWYGKITLCSRVLYIECIADFFYVDLTLIHPSRHLNFNLPGITLAKAKRSFRL